MKSLRHLGMHLDRTHCPAKKRLKTALLEKVRHIYNAERISKIRLIRTKFKHCLFVTDHRIRRFCDRVPLGRKFFKRSRENLLAYPKHIFLRRKTHLEIQLIKLSRRTIGTRVLIAETRRNLKIFIKTRHHQKLLVLLRRLRERVKFSLIFSGRHNIIPCPLR